MNERTKLVKVKVDDSNTVTFAFSIPFEISECMNSKAESIIQPPTVCEMLKQQEGDEIEWIVGSAKNIAWVKKSQSK